MVRQLSSGERNPIIDPYHPAYFVHIVDIHKSMSCCMLVKCRETSCRCLSNIGRMQDPSLHEKEKECHE